MTHPETLVRDVSNLCLDYNRLDVFVLKGAVTDCRDCLPVNRLWNYDIDCRSAVSGDDGESVVIGIS